MSDVSSRSRVPPTSSGLASIASRMTRNGAESERRESAAGTPSGSARSAKAAATARTGNPYVSTPHWSVAVIRRSGVVPKARATTARVATWTGWSGCQ